MLSLDTANEIWNICNEMLESEDFSAKTLIRRSNVRVLCTTDDPTDTLEYHKIISADENFDVKVLPTFRPDKALNITSSGFAD